MQEEEEIIEKPRLTDRVPRAEGDPENPRLQAILKKLDEMERAEGYHTEPPNWAPPKYRRVLAAVVIVAAIAATVLTAFH